MISSIIATACAAGLVATWFVTVHRELDQRRRNLAGLREQLSLHEDAFSQVSGDSEEQIAAKMLETNQKIYQEAVRNYNRLLKKPINLLPALLMKFYSIDEM